MLSIIMSIEDSDDRSFVLELYSKYEKNLYLTAARVLHNVEYAEDCVHDTMGAIIEHLEKFKGLSEENQVKYMIICCRNAATNKYNRRGRWGKIISIEEKEELMGTELADEGVDVCEEVVIGEIKSTLKKYFEMLDDKYKDVIVLKAICGHDNKEVSRLLNISEALVRQRYKRGKELLRSIGGKELYGLLKN